MATRKYDLYGGGGLGGHELCLSTSALERNIIFLLLCSPHACSALPSDTPAHQRPWRLVPV